MISRIMEWQEGDQPETDWGAIKDIESRVEKLQEGHRGIPSHSAQRCEPAQHVICKLADYEEVEESIAPQAKICRENLVAEFKCTVLLGIVAVTKSESKIPVRGGNVVGSPEILLKKNYQGKVKVQKRFRIVEARESSVQDLIDDLLDKAMMQPIGEALWNGNVFSVPKKTPGKWRLVSDYRYVNTQPEGDTHPTPLIKQLTEKQGKYKMWTIIDLRRGYYQILLRSAAAGYYGKPDARVRQCTEKMVKDGKWLVPKGILHEVVEQLHEVLNVATQVVDKMLKTLKRRVQSMKLMVVNRATTNNCVHC